MRTAPGDVSQDSAAILAQNTAYQTRNKLDLEYMQLLDQLSGREQQQIDMARSLGEMMKSGADATVHLTAVTKELLRIKQALREEEEKDSDEDSDEDSDQNRLGAVEKVTQKVGDMASQFVGMIAGTKAAAEVKGAFDAAMAVEEMAQFIASWGTDFAALEASVQYGLAAEQMFKVAGGGGSGRVASGGGSGGGGGSLSSNGQGSGSGSNGSGGSSAGAGWNIEGPHSQTASPTINLHINGQQFASVVVPVISQAVQNGTVHLTANTTSF